VTVRSKNVSEHVVLVTGALAGIGRAVATAFARDGASVVVSGRRDEEGKTLATELRGLGGQAEYIRADVAIEDDVRSLIERPSGSSESSTRRSTTPAPPVAPAL
jgi:NAD(P)-dependent dehydrogenase (short-subunit alcohol dehydrogenase family)